MSNSSSRQKIDKGIELNGLQSDNNLSTQMNKPLQKSVTKSLTKKGIKEQNMFIDINTEVQLESNEQFSNLNVYYKEVIHQKLKPQKSGKEYQPIELFWMILLTMVNVTIFPLMFLIYLCCSCTSKNILLEMRLLIRYTFPAIDRKAVKHIRSQASKDNSQFQNKIFSKDFYLKEPKDSLKERDDASDEDLKRNFVGGLKEMTKFTFNINSCSLYLLPMLFSIIYLTSLIFNIIGAVHSEGNKDLSEMFGINFIIIFYIFINICVNYYISTQGNYVRYISQKEEITGVMQSEAINPNSFYLKFSALPTNAYLMSCIKNYGSEFNNEGLLNHYANENQENEGINSQQNQNQDWISGVGLFTQYIFQSQKDSVGELPFLTKTSQNISVKREWSYYPLKFFNYWLFPLGLITLMVLLTVFGIKQSIKSDSYGQMNIIISLWLNLILYLFTQHNNRKQRRAFQGRLYGLQRLGEMIKPECEDPDDGAKRQVPTIDIFCTKSLKTWYDLRALTMKYKISSVKGWNFLLLTEFLVLSLEALSEFFDSSGNFIYTFPKLTAFFSILLIVGLVQRVIIFLFPSLIQFAKINDQFNTHKRILQQNLYLLEHLKIQYIFRKHMSHKQQYESQRNDENNKKKKKMDVFNKFVYKKIKTILQSEQQRKSLEKKSQSHPNIDDEYQMEEESKQQEDVIQLEMKDSQLNIDEEFSITEKFFEDLINQYKNIIYLLENNPKKHKIYSLDIFPITKELLWFFIITWVSSFMSSIISLYLKRVQESCTTDSQTKKP